MKQKTKKLLFILSLSLFTGVFLQFSTPSAEYTEGEASVRKQRPPFLKGRQHNWSDSILSELTLVEQLGQMLMVPAYPNKGEADKLKVTNLIKNQKVGGIIFFQGTPQQVAELAKYYQSISEVPLLIAIDGEWGLSMRLKNTIKYPKQMTLGAISSDMHIYEMGRDMAKQFKHLGIHVNFAPVVDINNNPNNPVINARSFGESRTNVAKKGLLYMKGMQDEGVLAFAKHFPGHGDTETDSHYGLPVITHSLHRLDSLELYPFKSLINAGVGGVMLAHMNIPALDSTPNLPSTLSPKIAHDLLQTKLGFDGLVVTDAMNMKGVAEYYSPVEANLRAVKAGNDILLMPHDVEKSINNILLKIKKDSLIAESIKASCYKILKAKYWALENSSKENFSLDSLHKPKYIYNRDKLLESAVTVVKNQNEIVPLRRLDTLRIAAVSLGNSSYKSYRNTLDLFADVDKFSLESSTDTEEVNKLKKHLKGYNLVLLSLHSNSISSNKNFGFSRTDVEIANSILEEFPSILIGLSNPYLLKQLSKLNDSKAILTVYENSEQAQKCIVDALFGATRASGMLPVSLAENYPVGHGINTMPLNRNKYVTPFEAGFDERKLEVIDSIVADAISEKAMPGCQILAAKDGQVFLNKAYGYHTYRKRKETQLTDLYDIASITKIAATVPSLMYLLDQKKINLDNRLADHLTYLDTCAKGDLLLSDILLHQAGLAAWIPFYWATIEPVYPSQSLYSTRYSKTYPIQIGRHSYANKHLQHKEGYFSEDSSEVFTNKVADNLYMNKMFVDSIWYKIAATDLGEPGNYKYSDLGFYLFCQLIEQETGAPLDLFTDTVFYSKLGAYTLGYNPLHRFNKNRIVPTENDLIFRKQIVQGYVHDPGAAMLGGVSGHAGLFSNANDLAKLMQMYLNEGEYGGEELISRKQIRKFTSCPSCKDDNRRGLGFDKPQPDTTLPGPSFKGISTKSFGHTGFTGTMTWADPDTGILFVFLSNRVYPDALNFKLVKMDVRTKIQEAIYKAQL